MTTVFFGQRWDAPIVDYAPQVATPVGQRCYDCGEKVTDGDRGFIRACGRVGADGEPVWTAEPVHAECDLRAIMGHQVGYCRCTGHLDGRDTARLVWNHVFGYPNPDPHPDCPGEFHGADGGLCHVCGWDPFALT